MEVKNELPVAIVGGQWALDAVLFEGLSSATMSGSRDWLLCNNNSTHNNRKASQMVKVHPRYVTQG